MNWCVQIGIEMGKDFMNAKDNFQYLKTMATLSTPKQMLLICYNIFCRSKKMVKIEEMPPDQKQKTWEIAKEIADGRLKNNEEMKDLCRCLLALEYILTL